MTVHQAQVHAVQVEVAKIGEESFLDQGRALPGRQPRDGHVQVHHSRKPSCLHHILESVGFDFAAVYGAGGPQAGVTPEAVEVLKYKDNAAKDWVGEIGYCR